VHIVFDAEPLMESCYCAGLKITTRSSGRAAGCTSTSGPGEITHHRAANWARAAITDLPNALVGQEVDLGRNGPAVLAAGAGDAQPDVRRLWIVATPEGEEVRAAHS
jgi:hypothetical protein